jgi:hypothetical protein
MTRQSWRQTKSPVFFSRHYHLNDEIAALDYALGWRQTKRSCFLFPFSRHNHLNDEIAALDGALGRPAQSPE